MPYNHSLLFRVLSEIRRETTSYHAMWARVRDDRGFDRSRIVLLCTGVECGLVHTEIHGERVVRELGDQRTNECEGGHRNSSDDDGVYY